MNLQDDAILSKLISDLRSCNPETKVPANIGLLILSELKTMKMAAMSQCERLEYINKEMNHLRSEVSSSNGSSKTKRTCDTFNKKKRKKAFCSPECEPKKKKGKFVDEANGCKALFSNEANQLTAQELFDKLVDLSSAGEKECLPDQKTNNKELCSENNSFMSKFQRSLSPKQDNPEGINTKQRCDDSLSKGSSKDPHSNVSSPISQNQKSPSQQTSPLLKDDCETTAQRSPSFDSSMMSCMQYMESAISCDEKMEKKCEDEPLNVVEQEAREEVPCLNDSRLVFQSKIPSPKPKLPLMLPSDNYDCTNKIYVNPTFNNLSESYPVAPTVEELPQQQRSPCISPIPVFPSNQSNNNVFENQRNFRPNSPRNNYSHFVPINVASATNTGDFPEEPLMLPDENRNKISPTNTDYKDALPAFTPKTTPLVSFANKQAPAYNKDGSSMKMNYSLPNPVRRSYSPSNQSDKCYSPPPKKSPIIHFHAANFPEQFKKNKTNSNNSVCSSCLLEAIPSDDISNATMNKVKPRSYICLLCDRSYKKYQGGIIKHLHYHHRVPFEHIPMSINKFIVLQY